MRDAGGGRGVEGEDGWWGRGVGGSEERGKRTVVGVTETRFRNREKDSTLAPRKRERRENKRREKACCRGNRKWDRTEGADALNYTAGLYASIYPLPSTRRNYILEKMESVIFLFRWCEKGFSRRIRVSRESRWPRGHGFHFIFYFSYGTYEN